MERGRAANIWESGVTVAELLEQVRAVGGDVWLADGELRYRMPQSPAANTTISGLRKAKSAVVAFLKQARGEDSSAGQSEIRAGTVPLAYSQLQHWRLYELDTRPALRHMAGVRRIHGELHVAALKQALAEVVARQGALRTTFRAGEGEPMQLVSTSAGVELQSLDLTTLPEARRLIEARRQISETIAEPVEICRGPLCAVRLMKLGPTDHILLVAMEHIIADMWSLSLLLRDLRCAYVRISSGQPSELPEPAVQFASYAARQREQQVLWLSQHGDYWRERLLASERLCFPADPDHHDHGQGWGMVPVRIDASSCSRLRQWCRARHVTLPMAVFAAYCVLVLEWCARSDGVIRFEGNGRSAAVADTIGYFTAPVFVRLQLRQHETFAQWVDQVQHAYYEALERADNSYFEAQQPRPAFTRNPSFNWVPEAGSDPGSTSQQATRWTDFAFENPLLAKVERDAEPYVLFGAEALSTLAADPTRPDAVAREAGEGELHGGVYFPRSRFSQRYMSRFSENLARVVRAMLDDRFTTSGAVEGPAATAAGPIMTASEQSRA
ncbi:MAG: condensation domain-containing protein [Pseudomonadota bacterium]|nr:condensation domain-containing protein [Pseudomonadota bacterium]